jgi:hypothetical protein
VEDLILEELKTRLPQKSVSYFVCTAYDQYWALLKKVALSRVVRVAKDRPLSLLSADAVLEFSSRVKVFEDELSSDADAQESTFGRG